MYSIYLFRYLILIGPGRRQATSSNYSKPQRTAPSISTQANGIQRKGTHSGSLNRYSRTGSQSHPNLPQSGARNRAKSRGADVNSNAAFMQTPDSGVCGYVFVVFFHGTLSTCTNRKPRELERIVENRGELGGIVKDKGELGGIGEYKGELTRIVDNKGE